MSTDAPAQPNSKWVVTKAKIYGWLTGLAMASFGGLMCSVPVGAFFGVPAVAFGLLLCLSFTVTMSASSIPSPITVPLVLLGLALLLVGRRVAPVDQIIESFQVGQELINNPGPAGAFGIPLIIIGYAVLSTVVPWVRAPERLSLFRSTLSMFFLQGGAILLLVGVILTASQSDLQDQPLWVWLAVPATFAIGAGLRNYWKGSRWIAVGVATGVTLPLIWFLLA